MDPERVVIEEALKLNRAKKHPRTDAPKLEI